MAVVSRNSSAYPMPIAGALSYDAATLDYYGSYYDVTDTKAGFTIKVFSPPPQVVGLVPVFPCEATDCRVGTYGADAIPNDQNFTLPVFADGDGSDPYKNDKNSFLFKCPGNYNAITGGDYTLEQLQGAAWVNIATLDDTTYGTPYKTAGSCKVNYSGYEIDWNLVLNAFGEGTYRFSQTGTASNTTYTPSTGWIHINEVISSGNVGISLNTPPGAVIMPQTFAVTAGASPVTTMQNWAIAINAYQATLGTPEFNAVYNSTLNRIDIFGLQGQNVGYGVTGGFRLNMNSALFLKYGSVQTGLPIITYCQKSPPFCLKTFDCYLADRTTKFQAMYKGGKIGDITKSNAGGSWSFCCVTSQNRSTPLTWNDSIRVEGFFGYEKTDYERKSIKYQTGVVNKIRDEAIIKFQWKAGQLPFWFHERFKMYGLLADILKVSDYNINNSDYNLKNYKVQADSSYEPDYKGYSRYEKVNVEFKAAVSYLIRNRCC